MNYCQVQEIQSQMWTLLDDSKERSEDLPQLPNMWSPSPRTLFTENMVIGDATRFM